MSVPLNSKGKPVDNYRPSTLQGSKHPNAKLTEDQVLLIRQLAADGLTRDALEKRFGVSKKTISDIVCRKTWRQI